MAVSDSMTEGIRRLPFSYQAEQALLGSLLIDPREIEKTADRLKPEDFYISEHRSIYSAMKYLAGSGRSIDNVTLIDTLEKDRVYEDRAGAEDYLSTLAQCVPNALNLGDYIRIVLEKSVMRQLIELCGTVSDRAFSDQEKADELVEYAAAGISAIETGRDRRGFTELNSLLNTVYEKLEQLCMDPGSFEGIKTGYSALDRMLSGIGSNDLVLIGARPSMGKTSLALNIAVNYAMMSRRKVAIFSLEMSDEQLASRILSSTAMVTSTDMRTGNLTQRDWAKLSEAVSSLSETRILIDDSSNIKVSEMKAKLRREGDIGLVVIDYLQLMQGEKHTDNRVLEIGDITRSMKLMAKELNVPVICCAQLSRSVEKNNTSNKRPMLSDLRDSGSIEQDADTVIFIYRDEYYRRNGTAKDAPESETPVAELIVAKNRHGSTGTVEVNWMGKYTKFYSIEERLSDSDAPPEYGGGSQN